MNEVFGETRESFRLLNFRFLTTRGEDGGRGSPNIFGAVFDFIEFSLDDQSLTVCLIVWRLFDPRV